MKNECFYVFLAFMITCPVDDGFATICHFIENVLIVWAAGQIFTGLFIILNKQPMMKKLN